MRIFEWRFHEVNLPEPESGPESPECHAADRVPVARTGIPHRRKQRPPRALAAYHFGAG